MALRLVEHEMFLAEGEEMINPGRGEPGFYQCVIWGRDQVEHVAAQHHLGLYYPHFREGPGSPRPRLIASFAMSAQHHSGLSCP